MSYIGYGRIGGESWIVPTGRQLLIPDTLGLAFVNETTLGLSRISASTMGLGSSDAGNNLNIYATLGAEKITWDATGWNEGGVEWTVAGTPIVITHATGNTTALTSTLASAIVAGVTYKVVITYAQVAGTCSYTLGGVTGSSIATSATSTSITDYITASTTVQMIITPLTTSNIVISSISIKALTDGTGDLTVEGNMFTKSQIIVPVSSAGYPAIVARNDLTSGIYFSSGAIRFSTSGTLRSKVEGSFFVIPQDNGGLKLGAGEDANLIRLSAGSLGMSGTGNGQVLNFKTATTLLTIAAGGVTSTWSNGIPANSIVIGISSRVTVVIPALATNYDVGIGGATTRYTTNALVAAGTTAPGTDDGLRAYTAATDVVVTTDANPADNTGRIRLTVHYIDITPATS